MAKGIPHRLQAAFASLILALACGSIQAQITTGSISGRVVDDKKDPLPGVSIVARSLDRGLERGIPTDRQGRFNLLGLPPGGYRVQATLDGYGAAPRETVVNLGQTSVADFTMQPVRFQEAVTVTAEPPLFNTTKTELSTVVTEKQIAAYPLLNREFTDLAVLAPGVRQSPSGSFEVTKKPGVYTPFTTGGTAGRNLNMSIDGADNNDPAVGFYELSLPLDGIKEFEVIQDMPTAEYGRSSGSVINVITRSGTNDFGGSVFGLWRNQNTRAASLSERQAGVDKAPSERKQYGFALGGPIVKDKLFYFISAERQDETAPIALSPDVTQFAGTEPPGFPFHYPAPGSGYAPEIKRDLWTVKIDWNASPDHLVSFRFGRDDLDSLFDGGDPLTDPTSTSTFLTRSWSATASWRWFASARAFNELTVHRNDYFQAFESNSPGSLAISISNSALGQGNSFHLDQSKLQIRDDFTWIVGRHSFKAGLEVIPIKAFFSQGEPGSSALFIFNTEIVPSNSMVSGDTGATPGTAVNGVDDGIDSLEGAFAGTTSTIGGRYTQYGAYFQDHWTLDARWQLDLGLRLDTEQGIWDEQKEPLKSFYECLADPANNVKCGRDPATINPPAGIHGFGRTFPRDPVNLSPRLGFIYRVGGSDRDVLRGSWGLFYDAVVGNIPLFNWLANCQDCFPGGTPFLLGCDPTDLASCSSTTQLRAGTIVQPNLPPLPVDFTLYNYVNDPRLLAWIDNLSSAQGPATFNDGLGFLVSPEWSAPYTSAFSLGWGHAFNPNLALDTNAIYRHGLHQMREDQYLGGNSGREAPWPAITDPNTGVASYVGQLGLLTTDGQTKYYSLQTSLNGRYPKFDFGASLNLSEARGTQDNAGTAQITADWGPFDLWDGGNIATTGGSIRNEWGRISGSQAIYTFLHGTYRFPHAFQTSAEVGYGTTVAVHPTAFVDVNGDGYAIGDEYVGKRGGGHGGDFFNINLRIGKTFDTGKQTHLEAFLDIFNLTNHDNYGALVLRRQFEYVGAQISPFPDYLKPVGTTLTPPRTFQLGLRVSF